MRRTFGNLLMGFLMLLPALFLSTMIPGQAQAFTFRSTPVDGTKTSGLDSLSQAGIILKDGWCDISKATITSKGSVYGKGNVSNIAKYAPDPNFPTGTKFLYYNQKGKIKFSKTGTTKTDLPDFTMKWTKCGVDEAGDAVDVTLEFTNVVYGVRKVTTAQYNQFASKCAVFPILINRKDHLTTYPRLYSNNIEIYQDSKELYSGLSLKVKMTITKTGKSTAAKGHFPFYITDIDARNQVPTSDKSTSRYTERVKFGSGFYKDVA